MLLRRIVPSCLEGHGVRLLSTASTSAQLRLKKRKWTKPASKQKKELTAAEKEKLAKKRADWEKLSAADKAKARAQQQKGALANTAEAKKRHEAKINQALEKADPKIKAKYQALQKNSKHSLPVEINDKRSEERKKTQSLWQNCSDYRSRC